MSIARKILDRVRLTPEEREQLRVNGDAIRGEMRALWMSERRWER